MLLDGTNPLLLYGYGSYGITIPDSFSTNRFSLLDRGFVYAIAHVRGGREKGQEWYDDGKLLKKKNTFLDFISCAEFLCEKNTLLQKKSLLRAALRAVCSWGTLPMKGLIFF